MRVTICAIGRLKKGPQYDMLGHYLKLLRGAGPQAGVTETSLIEIDDRKGPKGDTIQVWQGEQLLAKIPTGAKIIVLDEGGQSLTSKAFSLKLTQWAEHTRDIAFLIGGADGHSPAVLEAATAKLAFGPATWPHMLARIMLVEQLYRACCIQTGHPYHHG